MGKRDANAFRDRFNRWKNGELVYDKGRPIELFENGKDNKDEYDFAPQTMDEIIVTPQKNIRDVSKQLDMIPKDRTQEQKQRFNREWNNKRSEVSKSLFELGILPASFNPVAGTVAGAFYGALAAKDIYDNGLNWSNGTQLGLSALPLAIHGAPKIKSVVSQSSRKVPKITSSNANTITDSLWDAAYMNAVKHNNIKEALRLRDLHFVAKSPGNKVVSANGNPIKSYHTVADEYNPNFNEFNPNIEGTHSYVYSTDNKYMSGSYSSKIIDEDELNRIIELTRRQQYPNLSFKRAKKKILSDHYWLNDKFHPERQKLLYTYLQKPVVINSNGRYWSDLPLDLLPKDVYNNMRVDLNAGYLSNNYSTRSLEKAITPPDYAYDLPSLDYDGYIVKNVKDWSGKKRYGYDFEPGDVYAVKDANKVKLADAITYDDNGNVIPISKRDNFKLRDLRYSILPFLIGTGVATSSEYKDGKDSGIYIKPSHRGRLTALKKRTGKSEAELYRTGGPAVRKMVTFARNARKWRKG